MTISSTSNRVQFNGNSATTAFPFTFKTFDEGDLTVVLTDSAGADTTQTITTNYTVSLNADQNNNPGGTLTMLVAPATGEDLTIARQIDALQETDITNGGGFYPEVIENALDLQTMLAQQFLEQLGRAMVVPISSGSVGELPDAAGRASKYLAFDVDGNPVATAGTSSLAVISPFMETVLDDTTAAAARTTLGLAIGTNVQAYDADIPTVAASQVEMETGTEAALRSMSPLRVAQAISALAVGTRSRQVFTSGTAATYTTPAGCIAISIRMIGGGGGGGAQNTNAGAAGVASTWSGGSLSAGGGGGGGIGAGTGAGAGGTATNGDVNIPGGTGSGEVAFGGASNDVGSGGDGGNGAFGGGGGGNYNAAGNAGATNSGGGGGGGAINGNGASGAGGGAGGYVEKLITSPAATYTYTVGTGGAGGAAGTFAGGNGAAGIIIVDEFY